MSFNRQMRHCRKCLLLSRALDKSTGTRAAGTNATTPVIDKLTGNPVNLLQRTKMSVQNQWKILTLLKEYLSKTGYDKNIHLLLNKDLADFFQKVTYAQIDVIRKNEAEAAKREKEEKEIKPIDNKQKSIAVNLSEVEEAEQYLERVKPQSPGKSANGVKVDLKADQAYSMPRALLTLMQRLTMKEKDKEMPKWKANIQRNVTKHSIASRTRHVLNSIATAESNTSKWRRVEDLLAHIEQFPEARHHAIKEGAIRILLRARQSVNDERVKGSIREALAVMGYVDPLPGRGIRILAIDGGGIRGVLVVEMLKKLEQLTGKKVHEMFDYMCGVSTGAILSAVLGGHKRKSLDEISDLYKEISTKIFTQNPLKGTSSLVWSHAYYDTALWEQLLQEQLGDKDLIKTARDPNSPKFSTISMVVNHACGMVYVFRNYTLPHRVQSQYMGSYQHKLWEAVRASAAAPSYFEEFKRREFLHQDGGMMVNNPCAVAVHEAKLLWPNNPIQCIVSFGTGRTPLSVSGGDADAQESLEVSSWKEKFYKILGSATDTEVVHTMLNDLLPDNIYFRFNPYLTEMLAMHEIRPEKFTQLEQDARMYIRKNEEKFQQAAKALCEKRQIQQKANDWIKLQRHLLGF